MERALPASEIARLMLRQAWWAPVIGTVADKTTRLKKTRITARALLGTDRDFNAADADQLWSPTSLLADSCGVFSISRRVDAW